MFIKVGKVVFNTSQIVRVTEVRDGVCVEVNLPPGPASNDGFNMTVFDGAEAEALRRYFAHVAETIAS